MKWLSLLPLFHVCKGGYCDADDKLNKPAGWGSVFYPGAVELLEFYSADFSSRFPCRSFDAVVADPITACSEINVDVRGKYVLVHRGECAFEDKALKLAEAGAEGMILVNNADHLLFEMPPMYVNDPEKYSFVTKRTIPSVMVRERTWLLLRTYIEANDHAPLYLVGQQMEIGTESLSPCGSCTGDMKDPVFDVRAQRGLRYVGGTLDITNDSGEVVLSMDSFASTEGAFVPLDPMPLELPSDHNLEGCVKPMRAFPKNSAVYILRGGCTFHEKLENAYQAGARFVLFQNTDSEIFTPAVPKEKLDPRGPLFSNGTLIGSGIVFHKDGVQIQKLLQTASKVFVAFLRTEKIFSISKLKSDPALSDLQCFERDFDHAVEQLGLTDEAKAELMDSL